MKENKKNELYLRAGLVVSILVVLCGIVVYCLFRSVIGDRLSSLVWVSICIGFLSSFYISEALPPNKFTNLAGDVVIKIFMFILYLLFFLAFPLALGLLWFGIGICREIFIRLDDIVSQMYGWFMDHTFAYIAVSVVTGALLLALSFYKRKQKEK